MTKRIFMHAPGKNARVEVEGDEILQVVLEREGIPFEELSIVFVGESTEAFLDHESQEDEHESHPSGLKLRFDECDNGTHIHIARCHRIEVSVKYDQTIQRRFSPATRVQVVQDWAKHKLMDGDAAAAEYVLQIVGTKDKPRGDLHIGELPHEGCKIAFELVRDQIPQGRE